jgi:hypothetical protein
MDRITSPRSYLCRLAAQLLGPIAFAVLVMLGGLLAGQAAEAAAVCAERGQLLKGLAQKHAETPLARGLSADGGVVEVLVAPDGGWSLVVTYPKKPTCVVAVGEAWQSRHRLVGSQPTNG